MNIKNKTFISVLCIIAVSFVIGIYLKQNHIQYLQPDYAVYDNETGLVDVSTDIIVGEIIDSKVENIKVAFTEGRKYENDEDKMIYLVSDIKVTDVIKGDIKKDDIIRIKQLGDGEKIIDQTIMENNGYYKKGNKKVFFLKSFKEFGVPYSVINPIQGQIDIENDKVKENKNNVLFKNIKNEKDLVEKVKEALK